MAKSIDKQLDNLWSEVVKLRDGGKCCYCGKTTYLNSHHIYSRSNRSVRWNIDNGITLCASHHTLNSSFSAHKSPIEFIEWLIEVKGQDFIDKLRIKAKSISKFTQADKKLLLLELKQLKKKYS